MFSLRCLRSHIERTHIDDTELSILRDRLADADNIASTAGGGYTQVPLITSLPHYSDDFPMLVKCSYSYDLVKTLLDRLCTHSHATRAG